MSEQPGATGKFPRGKLNQDDEGELIVSVTKDPETGYVVINFGTPVAWTMLPPAEAIKFANAILKRARSS